MPLTNKFFVLDRHPAARVEKRRLKNGSDGFVVRAADLYLCAEGQTAASPAAAWRNAREAIERVDRSAARKPSN